MCTVLGDGVKKDVRFVGQREKGVLGGFIFIGRNRKTRSLGGGGERMRDDRLLVWFEIKGENLGCGVGGGGGGYGFLLVTCKLPNLMLTRVTSWLGIVSEWMCELAPILTFLDIFTNSIPHLNLKLFFYFTIFENNKYIYTYTSFLNFLCLYVNHKIKKKNVWKERYHFFDRILSMVDL